MEKDQFEKDKSTSEASINSTSTHVKEPSKKRNRNSKPSKKYQKNTSMNFTTTNNNDMKLDLPETAKKTEIQNHQESVKIMDM